MSKCLSCKKEVPAGARFCPSCGKAVEGEYPASKRVKIKSSYATLGWTLGILFALLALFTLLSGDFSASIPLAAAAALLIPAAREAAFARTGIKIPGIVRFVAVFGLLMWGSHLASPEVGEPEAAVAGIESEQATGSPAKGASSSRNRSKAAIDRAVCDSESVVVGEVIRPLRDVPLRVGAELNSQRVINERGSRATGSTMYRNVDASTRVLAHCEKGSSTYVTLIEPENLKGEGGWAETVQLREKSNPDDPYEGLISDYVANDYEDYEIIGDSSHPKSGRFQGREKEINSQKVAVAKRAIDSGRCEHVSYVYFQWLESAPTNLRYAVECEQGKRVTISSNDLASGAAVRTNEERAVDRSTAMQRCRDLIHARIIRQSTASYRSILGSSYYVAPATGNVRQILDFEAQNGFGQTVKHRAVCIFDPDGGEEITIQAR